MAINYIVTKKSFNFDPEKKEKYVARPVSNGKIGFEEFCKQVSQECNLHRGLIQQVMAQVTDCMIDAFKEGISVQLGELGTFRPTISSKASEKEEEVNKKSVTSIRIVYTPGKLVKEELNSINLKRNTR